MSGKRKIILEGLGLLIVISLALYLARLVQDNEFIQEIVLSYGYLGIFLISIFSGFNLIVPIPAVAFLPLFLQSGLSFWPTIFLITLGVSLADTLAYVFAKAGKDIASQSLGEEKFKRFYQWGLSHPRAPLIVLFFYACLAPLPNELMLVPMALSSYRLRQIVPILVAGNFIHQFLYSKGILGIFHYL
jgi:uncharacterized membrane protein YdjX (TVP38/TMEM64 family)